MAESTLRLATLLPAGMTPDDFYVMAAAAAAFLVVMAVGSSFIERDTLGPRIKALQERQQQMKSDAISTKRRKNKPKTEKNLNWVKKLVVRFKLLPRDQMGKMQMALITAGYRSRDAVYVYTFTKLIGPMLGAGMGLMLMPAMTEGLTWKSLLPVATTFFGLKLPDILVANARAKRYTAIRRSLADTLDLMLICAEAGLSLPATLERVSRELRLAYPEMAEELALTSIEMGFSPDRNKPLHSLAERINLQEVRGLVSVLVQTEKYGTPISQALRVLSTEFRGQRMLAAEQKAARLPAIMTVPMITLILPTLFVVVLTPAVLRTLDAMK